MIYGNSFEGGGTAPGLAYLTQLRDALYGEQGKFPDIIWDGIVNPEKDSATPVICVDNGDAQLLSIDAGNEFANAGIDMTRHTCSVPKLAPVELADI